MSELPTQPYLEQVARWPGSGRHILAHADESSLIVYQAYRPSTGRFALAHGVLGGPNFSLRRMSWIKTSFLWMMHRSSWGTARGQEAVLGIRLGRAFFESLLRCAILSRYERGAHGTHEGWRAQLAASEVRLQWDPDHDPAGGRLERRAIQLGLRGEALRAYATREILDITDMTPLIVEQRRHARPEDWPRLRTPVEHVYEPGDPTVAMAIGLDRGGRL